MITVDYCRTGMALNEFEAMDWAHRVTEDVCTTSEYFVSSFIAIRALCLLIARGELSHIYVRFVLDGKTVRVNRFGAIEDWPKGFGPVDFDFAYETLRLAQQRRKVEKENGGTSVRHVESKK